AVAKTLPCPDLTAAFHSRGALKNHSAPNVAFGRIKHSAPAISAIFRGSIPHPMQLLCTLRNRCRQLPRNIHYRGRYPLLGPDLHRLDRTSFAAGALIRSLRQREPRASAAPRRGGIVYLASSCGSV